MSGTRDVVLALDLGTGGCKSSLWSIDGVRLAEAVVDYPTRHPRPGWNEQRPAEWWAAVGRSVQLLTQQPDAAGARIGAVGVSGHSLGALPLDAHGDPLVEDTPIWSDVRASAQAEEFFDRMGSDHWYATTGNGFAPEMYPLFKAMWLRAEHPDLWERTRVLIGSKDWINYRLTGELATDHSYASGTGVYDLNARRYDGDLLAAAELPGSLLLPPRPATSIVGTVRRGPAEELGIPVGVPVVAGGVDNACMALGARLTAEGRVYASLGSSSWITVSAARPVIDVASRPFVFEHVVPGQYISALSTFSTGTTLAWLRALVAAETTFEELIDEACRAPRGAAGVLFLPMLSGGTPLEGGGAVRGAIQGVTLMHDRRHLVRAAMEGIAMSLGRALRLLEQHVPAVEEVLLAGGGAQHPAWNQIYADVFGRPVVRTSVGQQAAALGAAAIALVGCEAWSDLTVADEAHVLAERLEPDPDAITDYTAIARRFDTAVHLNARG